MLMIHPIPVFTDNYVWIIVNQADQTAIVIDPGDARPVIKYLREEKLQLHAILITHHHFDHTGGVIALQRAFDVNQDSSIPTFGSDLRVSGVKHRVQHADEIKIKSFKQHTIRVLAVPGHTLDHVAYVIDERLLFCGDTLFAGGCGRLFEGTAHQLYDSLQRLAQLPETTEVYCAHEYTKKNLEFALSLTPHNLLVAKRLKVVQKKRAMGLASLPSTLAEEKASNPFLRCHDPEIIAVSKAYAAQNQFHDDNNRSDTSSDNEDDPVITFARLRQWKDQY